MNTNTHRSPADLARNLAFRALVALCVSAGASSAQADWTIETSTASCASAQVIAERVRAQLPEDIAEPAPRTVRTIIREAEGEIVLTLLSSGAALGERRVVSEGSSCDELMDAAAFVIAVLLEGGDRAEATLSVPDSETSDESEAFESAALGLNAPPARATSEAETSDAGEAEGADAETHAAAEADVDEASSDEVGARAIDDEPPAGTSEMASASTALGDPAALASSRDDVPAVPPSTRGVELAVGLEVRTGRVPGAGVGPRLSFGYVTRVAAARVFATYLGGTQDAARGGIFRAGHVGAAGCVAPYDQFLRLEFCGAATLGVTRGQGFGFSTNTNDIGVSLDLGATGSVTAPLGPFFLRVGLVLDIGAVRPRFGVTSFSAYREVFRSELISFAGFASLGWSGGGS